LEADRLDVDDRARLAVFKGNVHAVQGDFVVRTAEMRALAPVRWDHRRGRPEHQVEPAQLTRIEARGKAP
jgi:lipopolysaccharide export system protein LptA